MTHCCQTSIIWFFCIVVIRCYFYGNIALVWTKTSLLLYLIIIEDKIDRPPRPRYIYRAGKGVRAWGVGGAYKSCGQKGEMIGWFCFIGCSSTKKPSCRIFFVCCHLEFIKSCRYYRRTSIFCRVLSEHCLPSE